MKIALSTIVMFYFYTAAFSARDTIEAAGNRIWIMGIPQHLISNGLRIETDFRLRNPANWLTVSSVIYYRQRDFDGFYERDDFERMIGGGLGIFVRHYPNYNRKFRGFYFKAGGGYQIISYRSPGFKWVPVISDGLEYLVPGPDNLYHRHLHSFRVALSIGYKFLLAPNLAIDIYLGPGMKYSAMNLPDGGNVSFNRTITPDFEGTYLHAGIRFGVGW